MDKDLIDSSRREFPVTRKHVYLDHEGVAPISLRVKEALEKFLAESAENGAFAYPAWAQQVASTRKACSRLINADPDEIAFVKSTSHGLSIVAAGLDWRAGDNVLVFEREFPSNLYPWLNLRHKGVEVRTIPSRNGRILFEDIEQLIDSRTRLLSISTVQFTNGFRIDLSTVGTLCREKGILLCVDAIQSLGVIPMDVQKYHVDFLSADAHKWLLGPEGIGIFYCRKELAERLNPPLIGWKSVQNEFDFDRPALCLKTNALRFEEGSMNLMGIIGLGAALELLFHVGIETIEKRVLDLGDQIIHEAGKRGLAVLSPTARADRGGIVTLTGDFDSAKTRDMMRERGVMVNVRGGGLRVSPHFYNTVEDINAVFVMLDLFASAK